jgi:uncharacterized protein (DUF1330 family)
MPAHCNSGPAASFKVIPPKTHDDEIGIAMPAYIISDVNVKDQTAMEEYRTRAARTIAQYGGRYVVRGGAIEVLEGQWSPAMLVIAEFPDLETARKWYRSPEYAQALAFRDLGLSRNLLLVDGVARPL